MAYIELRQLEKTFYAKNEQDNFKALKQVSLTIDKGDFITIIGGNGAGKSTLLDAIAGRFFVDKGDIVIDHQNITRVLEHKRAAYIARVFQNPLQATAPRMTIAENLALAKRRGRKRGLAFGISHKEKEHYAKAIQDMGLNVSDRLDTEMGVLSGGQRQALTLLMATLVQPKLLLLDEHTAALDPNMQHQIMMLTKQKIEEFGLTTLMITHNLQDALDYGNKLIVMRRGEIIKVISKEEKEKYTSADLYQMIEN